MIAPLAEGLSGPIGAQTRTFGDVCVRSALPSDCVAKLSLRRPMNRDSVE